MRFRPFRLATVLPVLVAVILLPQAAPAADPPAREKAVAPEVVPAGRAAQYVGREAIVEGKVVEATYQARLRGRPTFLNLDKPYREKGFTVLIWGRDRDRFEAPPDRLLLGKLIRVRGTVVKYGETTEIVVRDPWQIEMSLEGLGFVAVPGKSARRGARKPDTPVPPPSASDTASPREKDN